jgi:hypothetical protein
MNEFQFIFYKNAEIVFTNQKQELSRTFNICQFDGWMFASNSGLNEFRFRDVVCNGLSWLT